MKDAVVTCFLACIGAAIAVAAIAADATYLGTWKVSGATAAPWADPKQKADVAEQTRLIGKAVVFKNREIAGPEPLACKVAHYKEKNYTADVDAILAGVSARNKIVFLANPNNPTGTYVAFDEIKRLHQALPPHVLLVLDAAYAEYVRRNDYESGIELVATSDNVVMCRTFSKIHGLAALRLGWLYGPAHVVDAINRIRGPFNVNSAAMAAGIAAIEDSAHTEAARAHTMATSHAIRGKIVLTL